MTLVYVVWIDSETADGWDDYKNRPSKGYAESTGWALSMDNKYLKLVADIDKTNEHQNRSIDIPVVSIITVQLMAVIPTMIGIEDLREKLNPS